METTIINRDTKLRVKVRSDIELKKGYYYLINQIILATEDITIYIDINSIREKGLGALISPLDLNREAFKHNLGKINWLANKYIDGWLKFNNSEVEFSEVATLKNSYAISY